MDSERESWQQLCQRLLDGSEKAAAITREAKKLVKIVRCPSRPGFPVRTMSVREQLESLAAHNAYLLGRIVLLRQLIGAWAPPSGALAGDTIRLSSDCIVRAIRISTAQKRIETLESTVVVAE